MSYDRSPVALLRLVASSVSIAIVAALTELLPRAHRGLEADLRTHTSAWGVSLAGLADSVAAAWALVIVVGALVASFHAHRIRHALSVVIAAVLGALVVVVAARVGGVSSGHVVAEEWVLAAVVAGLAVLTVSFSVLASPLSRRSTAGITLLTLVGAIGADVSLGTRVIALLVAVFIGAVVALIIGTPSLGVSDEQLREGLERAKLPVQHLEPHPGDARGSFPWVAQLATGRRVFVKVQVADQHSADVLFRLWRRLRLRGAGDERAPATLRRAAEHEAFVAQRAASIGVRTPTVLALGMLAEDRGCFTVFESIDGDTFADVGDRLSDATLRGAWSQIQVLQRGGIAHRDLRAANLLANDEDDQPWVIDFGFAEVAASERHLNVDLVEFLASTATLVGAERAVDSAVAVMGAERAAAALPFVQPLATSAATRADLTRRQFGELREMLRAAVGSPEPDVPPLQRIRPETVAATLGLAVAVWVLLPQVSNGIDLSRVLHADPQWFAVAVAASAVTYVGAALSLVGSVPEPVPFGATFLAQVASSFTNRITPAKVEGMALNVRYLSKQSIDETVAATGVAVSTAAGAVVHVLLALIAVLWAGNVGFGKTEPPSARTFGVTGGIVVLVVGATFVVSPLRRWLFQNSAVPLVRRSIRAFVEVVRQPRELFRLAGGSALVTVANIVALYASVRALGPAPPLATVAFVYLAASAVAAAAPTPGGLGATEAALVAGLSVTGAAGNSAVPAVLLFRAATFWLPILPGWWSFVYLQHNDEL